MSSSHAEAIRDTLPLKDSTTVFVVDDDPAFRKSLRWLIESVDLNVETYASAIEFLENFDANTPGCAVLDVRMPGMSGVELQEQLRNDGSDIPVIAVTAFGDVQTAVRAMKGGATDFLEKPISDQVLLDHIQRAIVDDLENHRSRVKDNEVTERVESLTQREREVMDRVILGLSSKEIAQELGISFKTIESHRAKIMKKMGATSVPHLIRMNPA